MPQRCTKKTQDFSIATPAPWNQLPTEIRQVTRIMIFMTLLQPFLFRKASPNVQASHLWNTNFISDEIVSRVGMAVVFKVFEFAEQFNKQNLMFLCFVAFFTAYATSTVSCCEAIYKNLLINEYKEIKGRAKEDKSIYKEYRNFWCLKLHLFISHNLLGQKRLPTHILTRRPSPTLQ